MPTIAKNDSPANFSHATLLPRRLGFVALIGCLTLIVSPHLALAAPVSDSDLETFLGLTPGALDSLGNGDATNGSAMMTAFYGKANDLLTLKWNFLTNETNFDSDPNSFNDFAFLTISGLTELADTGSPLVSSLTPYADETGFGTFSFVIPADGVYTLGIGVANVGDTIYGSGLLVDEVSLSFNGGFETGDLKGWGTVGNVGIATASFGSDPTSGDYQAVIHVPEPSVIALFAIGFVAVLGRVRVRRT